jgi:hypothetical protein
VALRWPRALAWMDKGIPLSPVVRLRVAWLTFLLSILGLVLSWVFVTSEPRLVLTLSWAALVIGAVEVLSTADVRKQQENGDG